MRMNKKGIVLLGAVMLFAPLLTLRELPSSLLLDNASWLPFTIAWLQGFALPWQLASLFLIATTITLATINYISDIKLGLTRLPLTYLDIEIASINPLGLFDVLTWPRSYALVAIFLFTILVTAILFLVARRLKWLDLARIAFALLCLHLGFSQYGSSIYTAVIASNLASDLWSPEGLSRVYAKIGGVSFLSLTRYVEGAAGESFIFLEQPGLPVMSKNETSFIDFTKKPGVLPNIVIVLLESTFDAAKTFEVKPNLPEKIAKLFNSDFDGALLGGSFKVNVVGGGTWVTEFETITGLDSRLFGYSGYYTHVTLAPYVQRSLATYLKDKGYDTFAFYPTEGIYYGAKQAYSRYGFSKFFESSPLNLSDPSWQVPDNLLISRYLAKLPKSTDSGPFFAYMVTIGNHSPHPCDPNKWPSPSYKIVGNEIAGRDCQISEYLSRLSDSSKGVELLEGYLAELQRTTSRPYVLILFGDHQPFTFTGNGPPLWNPYNYDDVRHTPKNETFFQFRGSVMSPFESTRLTIPSYLLPTLVSAIVAENPEDLYLGSNLAMFEKCGVDLPLVSIKGLQKGDKEYPEVVDNIKNEGQIKKSCLEMLQSNVGIYRSKLLTVPSK